MNDQALLEEIYQNARTGIYAIETMMPRVDDGGIRLVLEGQRQKMADISHNAREMARLRGLDLPDAPARDKMGIWAGTRMNTLLNSTPSHLADMVIQGDTMGITKMVGVLNDAQDADVDIVGLGTQLVNTQRRAIECLKNFL